jgi:pimeloyl-ACP methyl ester carboxylesterase
MPRKQRMNDVIVLIPGITGSVLSHQNNPVWSMPRIIGPTLHGRTERFNPLYLTEDDPEREVLADGIRATALMTGVHGIHGLALGEGYHTIIHTIATTFDVVQGTPDSIEPVNFITFPYDWRRDNRVAAKRLQQTIETKLPQWQIHIGNRDAKVILIAHSMGGLVARHYLEVQGGWERCRALFTLGTPHRGAINTLQSLTQSHRLLRADLTNLVRSFTSAYQLLPIYPAVRIDNELKRITDTDQLPSISHQRAADALAFHHEIRDAAKKHGAALPYALVPIVGTHQPTLQSTFLENGTLHTSANLPIDLPADQDGAWLRDGDGTVPYISATPVEPPQVQRKLRYAERHAWLPSNRLVLENLCRDLMETQLANYLQRYQGGVLDSEAKQAAPALSVKLENLYQSNDVIRPEVQIVNQAEEPGRVSMTLVPESGNRPIIYELESTGDTWSAAITSLAPDVYRVEVSTYRRGPLAPEPVHDILEIVAQK